MLSGPTTAAGPPARCGHQVVPRRHGRNRSHRARRTRQDSRGRHRLRRDVQRTPNRQPRESKGRRRHQGEEPRDLTSPPGRLPAFRDGLGTARAGTQRARRHRRQQHQRLGPVPGPSSRCAGERCGGIRRSRGRRHRSRLSLRRGSIASRASAPQRRRRARVPESSAAVRPR